MRPPGACALPFSLQRADGADAVLTCHSLGTGRVGRGLLGSVRLVGGDGVGLGGLGGHVHRVLVLLAALRVLGRVVEAGADERVRLEAEDLLVVLEDGVDVPLLLVLLELGDRRRDGLVAARLLLVARLARLERRPQPARRAAAVLGAFDHLVAPQPHRDVIVRAPQPDDGVDVVAHARAAVLVVVVDEVGGAVRAAEELAHPSADMLEDVGRRDTVRVGERRVEEEPETARVAAEGRRDLGARVGWRRAPAPRGVGDGRRLEAGGLEGLLVALLLPLVARLQPAEEGREPVAHRGAREDLRL
mmetsp:Transcript_32168/g.88223  ORF Transcript_32168/g.88223 Transcript_32168/m.88223 type:complete len:303 (-) Transcript_32168:962-1870(-)